MVARRCAFSSMTPSRLTTYRGATFEAAVRARAQIGRCKGSLTGFRYRTIMRPSSRPESRPVLEQSRHGGDDGAVGLAQREESGLAVLVLSQRHLSCLPR
jgi:hypothetical protein